MPAEGGQGDEGDPKARSCSGLGKQNSLPEGKHICPAKVLGVFGTGEGVTAAGKGKGSVFRGVTPGKLNASHLE